MPILPAYTALVYDRQKRLVARAHTHPDESDDQRIQAVVAEEQAALATEIPPYIDDIKGRLFGQEPVYKQLLNGTFYTRSGKEPVCCLLFLDFDGVHRIVSHAFTYQP